MKRQKTAPRNAAGSDPARIAVALPDQIVEHFAGMGGKRLHERFPMFQTRPPSFHSLRFARPDIFAVTGRVEHDAQNTLFQRQPGNFRIHWLLLHSFQAVPQHEQRGGRAIFTSADQAEAQAAIEAEDFHRRGVGGVAEGRGGRQRTAISAAASKFRKTAITPSFIVVCSISG